MFYHIATFTLLVAVVNAGIIGLGGLGLGGIDGSLGLGGIGLGGGGLGLGTVGVAKQVVVDVATPPKYQFDYGVEDPKTGDRKQQAEVRIGDVVKGEYSLAEPDGTIRIVKYTADDHNGFNAIVKRIGKAVHPQSVLLTKGIGIGGLEGGLGGGLIGGGLGGGLIGGGLGLGGIGISKVGGLGLGLGGI